MGIENLKTTLINSKTNATLTLKTPIIGASGTYGYVDEYEDFIDLNCLGAISTKGITLEKRPGNSGNRIFEVEGGMINRIGLENVGIERFFMEISAKTYVPSFPTLMRSALNRAFLAEAIEGFNQGPSSSRRFSVGWLLYFW